MNPTTAPVWKVLVTGATGFVGREVVRQLRAHGHTVRALVRRPQSAVAETLAQTAGVELAPGDILDTEAVRTAAAGTQAVVHLVGIIREFGNQTFETMHVQATRHVVQAATAAGVQRLVHVSALGTRPDAPSRYHRTKWQAEELVRHSGLPWVILRPSLIYGPGDQFINLFARISRYSPVLPLFGRPTSLFQPVFIRVVGRCAAGALTHPEAVGQTFDVCGPERLTLEAMLRCLLALLNRKRLLLHVPLPLARVLAAFLERICPTLLRQPPPFNRDQLLMLCEDNIGDPEPANRLFQLHHPTFREGLATWITPTPPKPAPG
ncbi:MAG: oxidoreductase [Limisphaera sp.]|nr:MAG: oxidoreductase [Limisphaera sp.]